MAMKVLAISQARMGSSRLPNKVMLEVQNQALLTIHAQRVKQATCIDKFIVASTLSAKDDTIEEWAKNYYIDLFRGSEDDVLDRFYRAALPYQPQWVIRITSDCPLIDPQLIDRVVQQAIAQEVDYASNTMFPSFPDGQDIEVFKFSALEKAHNEAHLTSEREHVTPYIWKNCDVKGGALFKGLNVNSAIDYSNVRLTVDEDKDFLVIKSLIEQLGTSKTWKEYADYYLNSDICTINSSITRNEGYTKSINQEK